METDKKQNDNDYNSGRIIDRIVMGPSILGALRCKDTMCKICEKSSKRLGGV